MFNPDERKRTIKQKAVALLAIQERSRFVLRKKLKEKFDEPEDKKLIEQCLDELQEKKFLSDERAANFRVAAKSPRFGNQRIKWDLKQQGISDEIINEEMQALKTTEFSRAKAIWQKKFGSLPADKKEREKQVRFFASRGFSFAIINRLLRGAEDDTFD